MASLNRQYSCRTLLDYNIMKTVSLPKERLIEVFKKRKTATMEQLKKALDSKSSMTIFRKLKQLNYLSSCSHSGKYYTLKHIPKFNRLGLWFHKSVLFSSYDTLTETVRNLVEKSECGYTAPELEKLLKVKPNETLLKLIDRRIITRKKNDGNYIYLNFDNHALWACGIKGFAYKIAQMLQPYS